MKRSTKSKELVMEVMVGSFVFAALLGLSFFTIVLSRETIFMPKHLFEVKFENVMGLREGDNVVARGMPVGKVKSLTFESDGVHVVASVHEPLVLRRDYKMEVVPSSVLGGRHLQIDEGSPGAPAMPAGAELIGRCPRDLFTEATALVADVKEIADKIKQGEGTLGKLIYDDELYVDARDVVAEIKSSVKEGGLMKNLEGSASNINEIAARINRGEGTLGKLVADDSMYVDARDVVAEIKSSVKEGGLLKNLQESAANINEATAKINRGEGSLGKLVNDEELYEEMKMVMRDARATLNDMRETSPIVTFTSIFFGAF